MARVLIRNIFPLNVLICSVKLFFSLFSPFCVMFTVYLCEENGGQILFLSHWGYTLEFALMGFRICYSPNMASWHIKYLNLKEFKKMAEERGRSHCHTPHPPPPHLFPCKRKINLSVKDILPVPRGKLTSLSPEKGM